jgi:hypothetical protein
MTTNAETCSTWNSEEPFRGLPCRFGGQRIVGRLHPQIPAGIPSYSQMKVTVNRWPE